MKGEVIMFNFKQTKENAMNKVGTHSTLITFAIVTLGVGASIILASKEIPKAQQEVKAIQEREDLTKKQKAVESGKTIVKNCWKTAVVGITTILLVTGTAAITTANAATTVAGLTSALNLAEQKLKDTNEAINEIPNKKVKEDTQRAVTQKMINRSTVNMTDEQFARDENNPDMYVWVCKFDGVKIKATYKMIDNLEKLIDAEITNKGYARISDVYDVLVSLGAEIIWDKDQDDYYDVDYQYGWNGGFECKHDVFINDKGHTVYSIEFSEPSTSF